MRSQVERTAFTIAEAADSAGVSRERITEWIHTGELKAFKVGERRGKTMIPVECLKETLFRKAEAREGLPVTSPTLQILRMKRKKKAGIA